jgi:hypothetical protein
LVVSAVAAVAVMSVVVVVVALWQRQWDAGVCNETERTKEENLTNKR